MILLKNLQYENSIIGRKMNHLLQLTSHLPVERIWTLKHLFSCVCFLCVFGRGVGGGHPSKMTFEREKGVKIIFDRHPHPHLTSPHLTSPYNTLQYLTSPHLTSPHLTLPHLT